MKNIVWKLAALAVVLLTCCGAQAQPAGFGGFTPNPEITFSFPSDYYAIGSTARARVSITGSTNGHYRISIKNKATGVEVAHIDDLEIGGPPRRNVGTVDVPIPTTPGRITFNASFRRVSGGNTLANKDESVTAVRLALNINSATQSLTETAQLTATFTPNASATNYRFEIKRTTSSQWYTLYVGANPSFSWVRRVAGQFHLRVTAAIDRSTLRSANVSASTQFPDYSTIVGNPAVSSATDAAWTSTKNTTTLTSRREEGFWIRLNTTGSGTYEFSAPFYGATVGPGNTAGADPGARPADYPIAPAPNSEGVTYTVGLFHTHTPTTHRTVGRRVGPSGADDTYHTTTNIVGVVYDYTPTADGRIPAGHPINSPAQLYHSGPDRRPTP